MQDKAKPEPVERPMPRKTFKDLITAGNIKEVNGIPRFTTGGTCPAFGEFNKDDIAVPVDAKPEAMAPAHPKVEVKFKPPAYDGFSRDDLVVECKRLGIDPPDNGNKAELKRLIRDKLKEGQDHG